MKHCGRNMTEETQRCSKHPEGHKRLVCKKCGKVKNLEEEE